MKAQVKVVDRIIQLSDYEIAKEFELASSKYHFIAAWIGIIFNPIFAYSDYINLHDQWRHLFMVRLGISIITLIALFLTKRFKWSSATLVTVPLLLISLQNAYAFSLITNRDILGHNINFIALLIAASMFLHLRLNQLITIVTLSVITTFTAIMWNNQLNVNEFFVQGGLLLMAVGLFMVISINMRCSLTIKEIKARLGLQASNEEIKIQAEEIQATNENLEILVKARTQDLERKNKALEEYAWINAHKLRSPVASILGLMSLLKREEVNPEARVIMNHLHSSTVQLDSVVSSITNAIERAEYPELILPEIRRSDEVVLVGKATGDIS